MERARESWEQREEHTKEVVPKHIIERIKDARRELELEILTSIKAFEEKTGVYVESVGLLHAHGPEQKGKQTLDVRVKLEVD